MSPFPITVGAIGAAPAPVYVVTLTLDGERILLSRRHDRRTWEAQGGKAEPGETAAAAARRELFEESGVVASELTPLCDYWGTHESPAGAGRAYVARIGRVEPLPPSEMVETRWFDGLPEVKELTYPLITSTLYERAVHRGR